MPTRCAAWCAAAVSLLAPAAAHAAAPPAPGCLGMNFEDPAGDPREAGSGLDVTGGFLTVRDRAAWINLRFVDLDLAAYPQPDDLQKTVRVLYVSRGQNRILQAAFNRTGSQRERYSHGEGSRFATTDNDGEAHPGPDGVVAMRLPGVAPDGTVAIGEIRTESHKAGGFEFQPEQNFTRRTIDVAQGRTQSLVCPAAPAPTSPQPQPQPEPQPTATPPAGGDEPASSAPAAQARPTVTLRARRLRGGRVRLTGRASGVRDGARVVLRRGRRVVARAVVRDGQFSVLTRRAPRGAGVRAQVAGRTSALVRVR